jgi:glycine betaine/proline transport system substrate-binding protein
MKRLFTYLFLVSALMLSFSNLVYAGCGKLIIASQNWASAELMAELDKVILEKGYGCKVELIPGSTMATFTEMNKNKIHLLQAMLTKF